MYFFFLVENKNQCTWIYNYLFHRTNHAKNTFTRWNERTWHTHKPNCFGQKNYWHTERIRICILFRIRLQHFFIYLDKSLSLLQFSATPLPQFFFFFLPFSATPLPQNICSPFMGCHNSFFFPSIFSPNLLLFSNFSNLVATNFFPLIYGNFIAKITIKFPPLQFQQLGCHNFFFPPIFSNLVATIPFFLFPHSPTILAT